jgi:hypothetical protein
MNEGKEKKQKTCRKEHEWSTDDGLEEVVALGLEGVVAFILGVERKSESHLRSLN